jgi:hypothetical protein
LRPLGPVLICLFARGSVKEPIVNSLKPEKQMTILSALVEGNSIRSTERMTHTHRDTIMLLLCHVGDHCQQLMEHYLRSVHSEHLQVDEIWTFVQKKQVG